MSVTSGQSAERDEPTASQDAKPRTLRAAVAARQPADEGIHNGKEPPQDSPAQPSDPRSTERRISLAQREANRRNAQKSTGPRSAEGKRRSAMNAMTHGAYGRARAIPRGVFYESEREVNEYVDAIVEALAPRDALELVIARRIATADLRLARLERYECVAMAKVGRYIPGLHGAPPEALEAARTCWRAATRTIQHFKDNVSLDVEAWLEIANFVWDIRRTPEQERLVPDIHDDHEDAAAVWEKFVVEEVIVPIWPTADAACAELAPQAHYWGDYLMEFEEQAEEAEEGAVVDALAKGGPIDSASVLRARVQRGR